MGEIGAERKIRYSITKEYRRGAAQPTYAVKDSKVIALLMLPSCESEMESTSMEF